MQPAWFKLREIPYALMWSGDILWLPRVLAGEKLLAEFMFTPDQKVAEYVIENQAAETAA